MNDRNPPPPATARAGAPSRPRPMGRGGARRTWEEFREAGRAETNLLGQSVPFVGRRAELESLYNALRDALNAKRVRSVWVHGEAGIGKTRLVEGLHRAVAPHRRGVHWLAVGAGESLTGPATIVPRVLLELVGGDAVLHDAAPWQRVQAALRDLVGADHAPEFMQVVSLLLGIRSPHDTDEGNTQRIREPPVEVSARFVASLLRSRARRGPLVLAIEAPPEAAADVSALLAAVGGALDGQPAAVVVACREPPSAGLGVDVLQLEPLVDQDAVALLSQLLEGVEALPSAVVERVVERARGNPERLLDQLRGMMAGGEIARDDSGVWRWTAAGAEVEGLVGAGRSTQPRRPGARASGGLPRLPERLARLPAEHRAIVEAAAVFGTVFWFDGVLSVMRGAGVLGDGADGTDDDRRVLKARVMRLQTIDLISFIESPRLPGEVEFAFEHPTDAARLLDHVEPERRARYARLAAQWLDARPRHDRVADPARVALLFRRGGRMRRAAERYIEAGHAAREVGQILGALRLYAEAAACTDTDDADIGADARTAQGGALLRLSRHAEASEVLGDALRLARVLDDDVRCGVALLRLAQVARVSGRYDDALGHLDQGLRVLRLAGAHRFIADVMDEIGLVQLVRGQEGAYKLALAHFLKALALRRRSEDRRLVARSLVHIAKIHSARGHDEDARDAAKEAVDISERIQDRWGAARARAVLGEALAAAGRYRQALTTWAVAADLADEIGDAARKLELAVLRAEAYIALGDWEDAAALMVDTLDLAEEVKDPELLSGVYRVQSAISLEREALETADLDSLRAVEVAEQSGARLQVARANIVRGCVLGTRALSETGADSTVIDRQATRSFEAGLRALREMGDLVRQAEGLRSFSSYLEARGGGPRLASAKARLEEIEREMAGVSGV